MEDGKAEMHAESPTNLKCRKQNVWTVSNGANFG